jgi:hypothetical protein
MKKLLSLAVASVIGVTSPALADVFVTATITKDKDVYVNEYVDVYKTLNINVYSDLYHNGAAEAQAVANVTNAFNIVADADRYDVPAVIRRSASLDSSVNNNIGIVGVNQDVGNMVNQANIVSVALTGASESLTHAQSEVSQVNGLNLVQRTDGAFDAFEPQFKALIGNSINNNIGITGVNQNAGNMNNQTNALALALGRDATAALSEADLGQVNSYNLVAEVGTVKESTVWGSVNSNIGITQVNQSTGNMNNQGSSISVAATFSGSPSLSGVRLP